MVGSVENYNLNKSIKWKKDEIERDETKVFTWFGHEDLSPQDET